MNISKKVFVNIVLKRKRKWVYRRLFFVDLKKRDENLVKTTNYLICFCSRTGTTRFVLITDSSSKCFFVGFIPDNCREGFHRFRSW